MRAMPAKGPLTCPRAIPPGGTPPKGQLSRAHSASVSKASQRRHAGLARSGRARRRAAKIADSTMTSAAIAEQRELERPGEADGELPDAREHASSRPVAPSGRPRKLAARTATPTKASGHSPTAAARAPRARPRRAGASARSTRPVRVIRAGDREPLIAARSPLVTQAGIPIPPRACARELEPRAARAARPAPVRSCGRWPGRYCGKARGQRWTRLASGGAETPTSSRSSPSTRPTSSSSDIDEDRSSP